MKTIGLIGGMSWESSAHYYALVNQLVKERLGGFHSAKVLLHSVDFGEVEPRQRAGRWDELGTLLNRAALALEQGGQISWSSVPTPCTRWQTSSWSGFTSPCCTSPTSPLRR